MKTCKNYLTLWLAGLLAIAFNVGIEPAAPRPALHLANWFVRVVILALIGFQALLVLRRARWQTDRSHQNQSPAKTDGYVPLLVGVSVSEE